MLSKDSSDMIPTYRSLVHKCISTSDQNLWEYFDSEANHEILFDLQIINEARFETLC